MIAMAFALLCHFFRYFPAGSPLNFTVAISANGSTGGASEPPSLAAVAVRDTRAAHEVHNHINHSHPLAEVGVMFPVAVKHVDRGTSVSDFVAKRVVLAGTS